MIMDDKAFKTIRADAMKEFGDKTTHSHYLFAIAEGFAKKGYDLAMANQIKEASIDMSILSKPDVDIIEKYPGLLLSELNNLGLSIRACNIIRMSTASKDNEIRVGARVVGHKVIFNYTPPE